MSHKDDQRDGDHEQFEGTEQERFEHQFAQPRLLNIDKRDGRYVSKQTQEFWVCWRLGAISGLSDPK